MSRKQFLVWAIDPVDMYTDTGIIEPGDVIEPDYDYFGEELQHVPGQRGAVWGHFKFVSKRSRVQIEFAFKFYGEWNEE